MNPSDVIDICAQPAVATWTADSQNSCQLEGLKFLIYHDPSTNNAFFKLRAPVTFKPTAPEPKKAIVWLFIAPERIETLALEEEDKIGEAAGRYLGPGFVCLRFRLNRPPALVLPSDVYHDCKDQPTDETLDALRSLSRATSFTISASLLGRSLCHARLLSLCTDASRPSSSTVAGSSSTSCTLVSNDRVADTTRMYGGSGGFVIEGDSPALFAIAGDAVPPPQYADVGDSPPPMPVSSSEKKRPRRASSDAGPDARRPHFSELELKMAFEAMKAGLKSELKQDLRSELKAELKAELKDEVMAELKTELVREVIQVVETRVLAHVEDCLREQSDDFEMQLYDVRQEIGSTVYSEVEDQTYAARKELEEFVKDEMEEAQKLVEDRIADRLENANLSIVF